MPEREISYGEMLEILRLVEASDQFAEFHLKFGELEIDVRKASAGAPPGAQSAPAAASVMAAPVASVAPAQPAMPGIPAAAPPGGVEAQQVVAQAVAQGMAVVRSPMVGTFYCAPEPGAPAFVQVGQRVEAQTVVCIIEVMKLMNSITAGQAGVVTHVLATDSQPVEFGEALVIIDPRG